jgi:hypothetical protein
MAGCLSAMDRRKVLSNCHLQASMKNPKNKKPGTEPGFYRRIT